ncbi:hypothetical protein NQ318_004272 [Aromia moschata]|uniref:CHHC U11-48K-type domain-containing protein n=1 Tax=Aromia moschata TaxID=1265417 RepID=A0AAV8XQ49_9CUCU|nr:hypothetical protein NQ318_004272 [Aromia moschata]
MEANRDPEEMIICPYNHAHHIRRCRMNTHLVKCKKSYPDTKLVECEFNFNHKIPEPELQYHHENCPDRRRVEYVVYQEEGVDLNKFPVYNIDATAEESWDDFNTPAYRPQEYCERSGVLRHIEVESAAKRKDFRVSERRRLGELNNRKPGASSSSYDQEPGHSRAVTNRRVFPEVPNRVVIEERTPPNVTELLERLQIGKEQTLHSQVSRT